MLSIAAIMVRHTRMTILRFDAAAAHWNLLERGLAKTTQPDRSLASLPAHCPCSPYPDDQNRPPGFTGTSLRRHPGDAEATYPRNQQSATHPVKNRSSDELS